MTKASFETTIRISGGRTDEEGFWDALDAVLRVTRLAWYRAKDKGHGISVLDLRQRVAGRVA